MQNKPYEIIEHTADIGIRVNAKDLKALFCQAALAMFDIISEVQSPASTRRSPVKKIKITLQAENSEELLIYWLNELLSLSSVKELIFFDFKIINISDCSIEAIASGRRMSDYKVNVEIKAATYHDLRVIQTQDGWKAEVIFDV